MYRVRFASRQRSTFGDRYSFFLRDAVEDVPEYVVHWAQFEALAREFGLVLKYRKEFHQVFEEHERVGEFAQLLVRMKVVDENGESAMDEDQWEAASKWSCFLLFMIAHSTCLRYIPSVCV